MKIKNLLKTKWVISIALLIILLSSWYLLYNLIRTVVQSDLQKKEALEKLAQQEEQEATAACVTEGLSQGLCSCMVKTLISRYGEDRNRLNNILTYQKETGKTSAEMDEIVVECFMKSRG